MPWLKTLDASVAAVNQGGRRKGAAASTWSRGTPTSRSSSSCATTPATDAQRTHNLNLADWVPDLFMKRVEARQGAGACSTPKQVPELPDLWGEEFEAAYLAAEAEGRRRTTDRRATSTRG